MLPASWRNGVSGLIVGLACAAGCDGAFRSEGVRAPGAAPGAPVPAAATESAPAASPQPSAAPAASRAEAPPVPAAECPEPTRTDSVVVAGRAPLGPAREQATGASGCFPEFIEFSRYDNGRFAFAIDLPKFLLPYGREGGNGDGVSLVVGSHLEIAAWGSHNHELAAGPPVTEASTFEEAWKIAAVAAAGERLISASRAGRTFTRVVVSDGKRRMSKRIHEDGLIVGVEIAYDEARSSYFEVIERRLRDSIRTTAGGMYRRPPKPNRRYPRD